MSTRAEGFRTQKRKDKDLFTPIWDLQQVYNVHVRLLISPKGEGRILERYDELAHVSYAPCLCSLNSGSTQSRSPRLAWLARLPQVLRALFLS